MAVTADAGVGLRQLIDAVESRGFSLVAAPYWEGVTVAGLISTGAHGSSWWGKGGSVHDHVLGITVVVPASKYEGYAKLLMLEAQDPMLNAARLSLGVLGAISKVSLFSSFNCETNFVISHFSFHLFLYIELEKKFYTQNEQL